MRRILLLLTLLLLSASPALAGHGPGGNRAAPQPISGGETGNG